MENLPYSSYLVQRLWFGRRLYLLRKGAACDCYETKNESDKWNETKCHVNSP